MMDQIPVLTIQKKKRKLKYYAFDLGNLVLEYK